MYYIKLKLDNGSETSEEPPPPMPSLQPAPLSKLLKPKQAEVNKPNIQNKPISTIIPNVTIPAQNFQVANTIAKPTGTVPSYPLPLLILNGLQTGQGDKNKLGNQTAAGGNNAPYNKENHQELCNVLKDLLDTQKQSLEVEKQRLELEKQKMDFDQVVGSQLMTLVPIVGAILQRLAFASNQDLLNAAEELNASPVLKNGRKRGRGGDLDILKDSKILRTVLEQGIKKYMMDEDDDEKEETGNEECKNETLNSPKKNEKTEEDEKGEEKEEEVDKTDKK